MQRLEVEIDYLRLCTQSVLMTHRVCVYPGHSVQCHEGGPVIAFQIENEYGSFGADASYMRYLQKVSGRLAVVFGMCRLGLTKKRNICS